MKRFAPSATLRFVIALDLLAFAAFYFMPHLQAIESPVLVSVLELDGYGAWIAASHPLVVNTVIGLRVAFAALLFFGIASGQYVLMLAIVVTCLTTALGGLAVFTSLDLLALTILYLVDGYILARSDNELRSSQTSLKL